jgi:Ca2+-binding EF-hand superfamily protein
MQMALEKLIIQVITYDLLYVIEWIVATINKEKLLSTEKLKAAFQLFDKDGGGTISSSEIKDVLCGG